MAVHKNNQLIIEREVNASSDLVWKALTDYKILKQWMPFFSDFNATVGFETRFKLGSDEEHQYVHLVKVLEVVPGEKLTYTWRYPDYAGDSHITFELFPDGEKTKVVLTHTITEDFPADNPDFDKKNFAEGWTYTIDGLKKIVEKVSRT
jgi:uncharacterized protein YndB with AHSA1/START domain